MLNEVILIVEFSDCNFKMRCKNVGTIRYPLFGCYLAVMLYPSIMTLNTYFILQLGLYKYVSCSRLNCGKYLIPFFYP